MDFTLTPISHLDAAALARLADLHCAVMHTLLADLGAPLVLRYYQLAHSDPSVLGVCALDPNGDILGWAMGSPNPATLNAGLRQPLAWFLRQILRQSMIRPGILPDLASAMMSTSSANTIHAGQVELTYIGVATGAQGHGLGRTLLAVFIDNARSNGYTSVVLSVETNNPGAIALYTNCGFCITQTFKEGRFERHRMECEITSIQSRYHL